MVRSLYIQWHLAASSCIQLHANNWPLFLLIIISWHHLNHQITVHHKVNTGTNNLSLWKLEARLQLASILSDYLSNQLNTCYSSCNLIWSPISSSCHIMHVSHIFYWSDSTFINTMVHPMSSISWIIKFSMSVYCPDLITMCRAMIHLLFEVLPLRGIWS